MKLSQILFSKISQILISVPSLNGCLLNGEFFPNPKSNSVHLSVANFIINSNESPSSLSSPIINLNLTNVSTKSTPQILSDIDLLIKRSITTTAISKQQQQQQPLLNYIHSYIYYFSLLFQRKINISFLSDQYLHKSSYGSVIAVPFQTNSFNVDEFSMCYSPYSPYSLITISSPVILSFPEISISTLNRTLKVPITITIEGKNISIQSGIEFINRLKSALQSN